MITTSNSCQLLTKRLILPVSVASDLLRKLLVNHAQSIMSITRPYLCARPITKPALVNVIGHQTDSCTFCNRSLF
ncbi:hypothetical protein D3C87_1037540 [compost metagenome]